MEESQQVSFRCEGATAIFTFDSPLNRNALTEKVRDDLRDAVARVRSDASIRALVLTGANGYFCSGGDLSSFAALQLDSTEWRERMNAANRWLQDLITLEKPVIAAVDGAAYGAGFSLALAADFVLATPRARFSMAFIRLGVVPDLGALYTLPRAVGVQRARELMLSSREVDSSEARDLGIVMEVHEAPRLMPRAMALADSFAGASALAVSLIKRATSNPGELTRLLDAEANGQALAFASSEHRDALQRFLGKQPLAFRWPTGE